LLALSAQFRTTVLFAATEADRLEGLAGAVWLILRLSVVLDVIDAVAMLVTVMLTGKVANVAPAGMALGAGVPLITPVSGLMLSPVGRPVADQV
jgi:hypothetical protein